MSFTKDNYSKSVIESLKGKFNYRNPLEIPRLKKICLNVRFKAVEHDNNFCKYVRETLTLIAGQKATFSKARQSISSFKLRKGMSDACIVTLRGDRMYEFCDRLVYIALPRIRDFRGLSGNAFNQSGHYSFGLKEHIIFPEVELDKVLKNFGMDINIVTTARTKEECKALLVALGFPIK